MKWNYDVTIAISCITIRTNLFKS